jgi:diguanylate cyclase (GGDEF)-like protein
LLTFFIGFVDLLTGEEIALSLFYLIPIALVSWFTGSSWGLCFSIACAIVWQLADIASGRQYSTMLISYWNAGIRFGFFIIVVSLLSKLKKSYEHEKMIARTDNLTNAVNRRHFFELLQSEIHRSERNKNPFSVAYLDLDNFKYVNDQFGHDAGDKLLCLMVRVSEMALRKIDVVARLVGDEFAFLLPETSQEGSRIAISKLQASFQSEMQKNG